MLSSFAFNFNLRPYTLATMVLACDLTLPAGLFMPTILWGRGRAHIPTISSHAVPNIVS
jgi:hypothetical protein